MLGSHCRAIRYERHDWPFVADRGTSLKCQVWMRRWCESIRSDTICCAWMRYGHDWSISGDTICHDLVSRSNTITYVPIGLSRSSPRLGLDLTRSSRSGSPIWDDLVRADTFGYVPIRSTRTDALCCDRIRLWSRCPSRSRSRGITIWATIGPRRVYIQPDWPWTSLFLELLHRVNTTTDNHWWWQELRMMTTWHLQYYCMLTLSPERKKTSSSHTSYNPNHKGPGELQSGSSGCDHGSQRRGDNSLVSSPAS